MPIGVWGALSSNLVPMTQQISITNNNYYTDFLEYYTRAKYKLASVLEVLFSVSKMVCKISIVSTVMQLITQLVGGAFTCNFQ